RALRWVQGQRHRAGVRAGGHRRLRGVEVRRAPAMVSDARIAVVTGGARGIGAATATALARAGATVAIGDLDLDLARRTASGIGAVALPLDVTDRDRFTAFLDEVETRLGP